MLIKRKKKEKSNNNPIAAGKIKEKKRKKGKKNIGMQNLTIISYFKNQNKPIETIVHNHHQQKIGKDGRKIG